jgi:nucleotide-binding universal stress UspA family protein
MKSLLICTDFSEPSMHAAKYACMLAQQYHFKFIVLFHAYQTFVPAVSLPLPKSQTDEIYNTALKQLHHQQQEIKQLVGPGITFSVRAEDTLLGESINRICQKENTDLVVMGMKGKSGVQKSLAGSNTINVAQNSYYPVLVVPEEAAIEPVGRILVACDLSKVSETIPTSLMNEILGLLQAPLTVLNIDYRDKHFSPGTPHELYHLHHVFDHYHPKYAFTEDKNIASGILEYAKQNSISLIIAMPKNYNFFHQLFHASTTEKLMYQSPIPLLTLHAP